MSLILAVLGIGFRLLILGAAIWFTIETSRGEGALRKVGRFLGLLVSIVPIVGLIMYVVFRGKPNGFGERCAAMAIMGVVLYTVFVQPYKRQTTNAPTVIPIPGIGVSIMDSYEYSKVAFLGTQLRRSPMNRCQTRLGSCIQTAITPSA